MSRTKRMVGTVFAVAFALLSWGCTSTPANNAPKFSAESGTHPAGWMDTHYAEYSKNPAQCTTCHGSATDPAAAGGISKVSCFTCHPKGPGHPAGWADPAQHGRLAAMAAPGEHTGFASCKKCHGETYKDGYTSTTCLSCHTKAPHPNRPWETTNPLNPIHSLTHQANAPECYTCHENGQNSTHKPTPGAPVGSTPGCFNNTMCHDYGQSGTESKI